MIWWKRFWSREVLGGVKSVCRSAQEWIYHEPFCWVNSCWALTINATLLCTRMQILPNGWFPQMGDQSDLFWSFCSSFSNWVCRLSWLALLVWSVLENLNHQPTEYPPQPSCSLLHVGDQASKTSLHKFRLHRQLNQAYLFQSIVSQIRPSLPWFTKPQPPYIYHIYTSIPPTLSVLSTWQERLVL